MLVDRRVYTALLDEVLEQPRHFLVEARVRELLADDGVADIVDDALGDRIT